MISEIQFNVLHAIYCNNDAPSLRQRELSEKLKISLGKINACCKELKLAGLVSDNMCLAEAGLEALAPYRVKNAVIMAAGMGTRLAPLSYEKPKGLMVVKGEILIERMIRQLQDAGITDITVVIGYLKEKLFYLEEKFGVKLVINEDYYRYNNTSTLIRVTDQLSNTYICCSDNYFIENVFEQYVYRTYYAAVYSPGSTEEWCIQCNSKGRIQHVTIGGSASWCMFGHVYFSREFSQKFVDILKREYDLPLTQEEYWEALYVRHIDALDMYMRPYESGKIQEFDSLEELRKFDPQYVTNIDSNIFRNIESILNCDAKDIVDIQAIKLGLNNFSFLFTCRGKKYVYRHPGQGTDAFINRQAEANSMQIAKKLGLDETFIAMDPDEGWKISSYVEDARMLDYHNDEDIDKAFSLMRKLHAANIDVPYIFDLWGTIQQFYNQIISQGRGDFEDFESLYQDTQKLYKLAQMDNVPHCLTHCDCYDTNFLIDKDGNMSLIDWEFAGKTDPASDLGTFLVCSDFSLEESIQLIHRYYQREPSKKELRHQLAYASLLSYYWFMWAMCYESNGKPLGEYLYIWYRYTKLFGVEALKLYDERDTDE